MEISNLDVKKFVKRLRRFGQELVKSDSANVSGFSSHDLKRVVSYHAAMVTLLDEIQSLPELDFPESSPKPYEMGDLIKYDEIENESIADVLELFERLEEELLFSQSSRISNRFMIYDEERTRIVLQRFKQLLEGYVSTTTPLDLPESSPRTSVVGRGKTSVKGK